MLKCQRKIIRFEYLLKPSCCILFMSVMITLQLLWIETPTNPTMKIVDIEGACKIAHKHKV